MENFADNSVLVTILGMSVVLITLSVLMLLTKGVSALVFFSGRRAAKRARVAVVAEPPRAPAPEVVLPSPASPARAEDEEELVAVLTAAAVVALGAPVRVLEFSTRNEGASAWVQSGRAQNMALPKRM